MPEELADIDRLNLEITNLKSLRMIKETEIEKLQNEIGTLKTLNFSILKDKELLLDENTKLKVAASQFQTEKTQLQNQIKSLEVEAGRPKLLPEQLTTSLHAAILKMEDGLKTTGGRVNYTIGNFDAEIKANLSIDSDNKLFLKMPGIGEIVSPENLSVIKLSLKPLPAPRLPLIKVPPLIGMSRNSAVKVIQDIGLKTEIQEKQSKTPTGTVIDQKPEAYTELISGAIVTLIVAIPENVKIPNFIGMDKGVAIKILKQIDLEIGKIEEKIEKAPPNTVLSQDPSAGTEVERGCPVDLIVVKLSEAEKVPDVTGLTKYKAEKTLLEQGWRYKFTPISVSENVRIGRVGKQKPEPGTLKYKTEVEIELYIALHDFDIEAIEGIGEKFGKKFRELSPPINTLSELSLIDEKKVRIGGISDERLLTWKYMANLMTTIEGLDGNGAEILVKCRNIKTPEELGSVQKFQTFYNECIECANKIKIPKSYIKDYFTQQNVKKWIEAASEIANI